MEETKTLPYAIGCALREIAGDQPSTDLRVIGNRRPSPEALRRRRAYSRPLLPSFMSAEFPNEPESKFEYSASMQDLVDFGLIKNGFWHDGDKQTTFYGFHLTDKAMRYLKATANKGGV